jgi:hypothetical protein
MGVDRGQRSKKKKKRKKQKLLGVNQMGSRGKGVEGA